MSKINNLTRKEREICTHLKEGKSASEIAKTLNLSPRTVEFYTNNIKEKLECETKIQLVVKLNQIFKTSDTEPSES